MSNKYLEKIAKNISQAEINHFASNANRMVDDRKNTLKNIAIGAGALGTGMAAMVGGRALIRKLRK